MFGKFIMLFVAISIMTGCATVANRLGLGNSALMQASLQKEHRFRIGAVRNNLDFTITAPYTDSSGTNNTDLVGCVAHGSGKIVKATNRIEIGLQSVSCDAGSRQWDIAGSAIGSDGQSGLVGTVSKDGYFIVLAAAMPVQLKVINN